MDNHVEKPGTTILLINTFHRGLFSPPFIHSLSQGISQPHGDRLIHRSLPPFLPFFDFFFQFHDGIFQCFVIFHLLFDFGNAMDDGGMVSAAEAFADFGQGNV